MTPVHLAAIQIQSDVLNVICDIVGSEILELPDATGLTPLMHACVSGSEECVKFILKKKVWYIIINYIIRENILMYIFLF